MKLYQEIYGHLATLLESGTVTPKQAVQLVARATGFNKSKIYFAHHHAVKNGERPLLGRPSKYFDGDRATKAVRDSDRRDLMAKNPAKGAAKNTVSVRTNMVITTLADNPKMIEVMDEAAVAAAFKEIQDRLGN